MPSSSPPLERFRPAVMAAIVAVAVPALLVGCSSPPQILEISPGKGALDVPTNAAIRIRFDRPLDRGSVRSRFQLIPRADGDITWEGDTLVFHHETLATSTQYQVRLSAGYRDLAGNANGFTHSWTFQTEAPPTVRALSPGQDEQGVDPSAYLSLAFSRDMNADSFRGAVTISPSLDFALEGDPTDARRILLAPRSLLAANTDYQVSVAADATDADGNHIQPLRVHFTTGPVRPLTRWITFIASTGSTSAGSGVWMVDSAGFPRNLEQTPADSFSWSPDGSNLLVRHPDRTWTDYPFASDPVTLPFRADWAAYLGPTEGFVYLDQGRLSRRLPSGDTLLIASGVEAAAVSHDANRIAFSQASSEGWDLRAYDVGLRAQYRVQREPDAISDISWSSDGTKLAYVLAGSAPAAAILRVKALGGSAGVTSVTAGQISGLAWLPDSDDVTFSARVLVAGQQQSRIFRVNTALASAPLAASAAIGPAGDEDAFLPQPSPDGHQIAFLLGSPDTAQVWLMNADGTGASRLTSFDSAAFPYSCLALHWASF